MGGCDTHVRSALRDSIGTWFHDFPRQYGLFGMDCIAVARNGL